MKEIHAGYGLKLCSECNIRLHHWAGVNGNKLTRTANKISER